MMTVMGVVFFVVALYLVFWFVGWILALEECELLNAFHAGRYKPVWRWSGWVVVEDTP